MKFEVGKKYFNPLSANKTVYECVFVDAASVLLRIGVGHVGDLFHPSSVRAGGFVEYKEPVVHERYVFWWERVNDPWVWAIMMPDRGLHVPGRVYDGAKLLKVDTISYTETK